MKWHSTVSHKSLYTPAELSISRILRQENKGGKLWKKYIISKNLFKSD